MKIFFMKMKYSIVLVFFLVFPPLFSISEWPNLDSIVDASLVELITLQGSDIPTASFPMIVEAIKQTDAKLTAFSQAQQIIMTIAPSLGLAAEATPYQIAQE